MVGTKHKVNKNVWPVEYLMSPVLLSPQQQANYNYQLMGIQYVRSHILYHTHTHTVVDRVAWEDTLILLCTLYS